MTKYYDYIHICIVKSYLLSRDHIIAITRGWIFDGNPKYAIVLSEQKLNWCAGHGITGIYFVVFIYEQIQIGIKEKNLQHKNKNKKLLVTYNIFNFIIMHY